MAQDPAALLPADYLAELRALASSRRFGERDRLGTVGLIDDAARLRAVAAATRGRSAGLARPLQPGGTMRGDERPAFALELFYTDGPVGMGSDHVELDCHGLLNTHVDGLNHLAIDGSWYGGWAVGDPDSPGIEEYAGAGLVTRAVHVDVPAYRGAPWVDGDAPVTADDIEGALAAAGVTFEPGDALLLDMGRDRFEAAGHDQTADPKPGLGRSGAEWIARAGASLLCWDFLDAVHPAEPRITGHALNWAIGLVLVDNCDFGRLRRELAAAGGPPTGALVVGPLPIAGATGCNVNPVVVI